MNWRKFVYFGLVRLRGQRLGTYYRRMVREDRRGIRPDTTRKLLVRLLDHCRRSVPYYAEIIQSLGDNYHEDPFVYLEQFPVMTKDIIRKHFADLKSSDLSRRKLYFNMSGGSTGEPVRVLQDWDFAACMGAIQLLYSRFAGKEIGECEVNVWASQRDILSGFQNPRAALINKLTNTIYLDTFQMTTERMREYLEILNHKRPKLIIGYVDSLYELARQARRDNFKVAPQKAIISTAANLLPYMRQEIEQIFQCKVYNRYGSREVGDIASERSGLDGLWVAPWGNYVEIVDDHCNRLPAGKDGTILVTSLTNYVMPLIRYEIGDMGALAPVQANFPNAQILQNISGRTLDRYKTRSGKLVHASFFGLLLYFRDWIQRYQVVQKDYGHIVFRFVKRLDLSMPAQDELDLISSKTQEIVGEDCRVQFEFVDDIPPAVSGKNHFFICEIEE
jgi:phenylacetate-CoA ligase